MPSLQAPTNLKSSSLCFTRHQLQKENTFSDGWYSKSDLNDFTVYFFQICFLKIRENFHLSKNFRKIQLKNYHTLEKLKGLSNTLCGKIFFFLC